MASEDKFIEEYKELCNKYGCMIEVYDYDGNLYVDIADKKDIEIHIRGIRETTNNS